MSNLNFVTPNEGLTEQIRVDDTREITKPRRSIKSAKAAGTYFAESIAGWFRNWFETPDIERRVQYGRFDKGDIAGVKLLRGGELVIECKNYAGDFHVTKWLNEAEVERGNADAPAAVVIAKRRGTTDPAQQVVFMTVGTLGILLDGGVTE